MPLKRQILKNSIPSPVGNQGGPGTPNIQHHSNDSKMLRRLPVDVCVPQSHLSSHLAMMVAHLTEHKYWQLYMIQLSVFSF